LRLRLDRHALLGWPIDDPKFPARTSAWIDDRANEIAVSPVSAYELRFKALKGLRPGGDMLAAEIARMAELADFTVLTLTLEHAIVAGALPLPHRDPFDRLLAAQALVDGYTMLSTDLAFDTLGAPGTW
jgi:PIN domain nuclease of toxin-antitoxin system